MTVISLSDKTNNSKYITPRELIKELSENEEFMEYEKILIIGVTAKENTYSLNYMKAKMNTAESILALEIAKNSIIKDGLGDII